MSKQEKQAAKAWNTRCDDTVAILNQMKQDLAGLGLACSTVLASFDANNKPIGFLTMSQDPEDTKRSYLAFMATRPGTKGEGRKLVERAVKQSDDWGSNGRLKTRADPNAQAFYKALGFRFSHSLGFWTVKPEEKRDLWTKIDGEWKLKKYLNPRPAEQTQNATSS